MSRLKYLFIQKMELHYRSREMLTKPQNKMLKFSAIPLIITKLFPNTPRSIIKNAGIVPENSLLRFL